MATNYPSSLDSFINPQPWDSTVTISHAWQHDNINDAVTALETKVWVNNSTVTNSIDYLLKANPEWFLINWQIVVSESWWNLTVALKWLNWQDPSATNPVYVRIGNTIRSVTSALSVTKNAATNWFNAWSSELATQLINYFTYLWYNSTDWVVIWFARIPYAKTYWDFSATTTNAKYCAISTITNATSTDIYVNIWRFSATLSATPWFTWSISGTGNVINRPIYETDIINFNPVLTGITIWNWTVFWSYQIIGNRCYINTAWYTADSTTSFSWTQAISLPFSTSNSAWNNNWWRVNMNGWGQCAWSVYTFSWNISSLGNTYNPFTSSSPTVAVTNLVPGVWAANTNNFLYFSGNYII